MMKTEPATATRRSLSSAAHTARGGMVAFPQEASLGRDSALAHEWTRKLWHMVPGTFALVVPLIPHRDPMSPIMRMIIVGVTSMMVVVFLWQTRRLSRPGERDFVAPVLGYSLAVMVSLLLFPAKMEIGLAVLAILAFGDGAAALAGTAWRSPSLPWNRQKTFAGTLAFLLAATPAATWAWWVEANPDVSFPIALFVGFIASAAAAFAESIRSRISDNIRVGVTSAATLWGVDQLLILV